MADDNALGARIAILRLRADLLKVEKGWWNSDKHPRYPRGNSNGGEFEPKQGGKLGNWLGNFFGHGGENGPYYGPQSDWAPQAPSHSFNRPGSVLHQAVDDEGGPVYIHRPTEGSSPNSPSWTDPDAVLTVVPGQKVPASLNGIKMAPAPPAPNWSTVAGQNPAIEEGLPKLDEAKGYHPAAGVIIQEPDGRVWLTKPTNGYGGYRQTFPKGTQEHELTLQQTAIKEAWEETGLQIELTGVLGDFKRTTSISRYYLARRVGGSPAAQGWESQALRLVPHDKISSFLHMPVDREIWQAYKEEADIGKERTAFLDRVAILELQARIDRLIDREASGNDPFGFAAIRKIFDEDKHPRWPKGSPLGGKFMEMDEAGLPKPPQIGSAANPQYQKKVDAAYAAAKAGDKAKLQTLLTQATGGAEKYGYTHGAQPAAAYLKGKHSNANWTQQTHQYIQNLYDKQNSATLAHIKGEGPVANASPPSDLAQYKKVGGKLGGTSAAGVYQGPDGHKYYVKGTSGAGVATLDRAKNELLASKLLHLAGAGAPEMHLVTNLPAELGGPKATGIASKFVEGTKVGPINGLAAKAAQQDFAAHAWLSNYDVIGQEFDNSKLVDGKAVNIDPGGALLYRAQGEVKFKDLPFGKMPSKVEEWDTLRNGKNQQTQAIYGSMSKSQLEASAAKLASISDKDIQDLVAKYGPGTSAQQLALSSSLIARRDDILKRAGIFSSNEYASLKPATDEALKPFKKPAFEIQKPSTEPMSAPKPAATAAGKVELHNTMDGHNKFWTAQVVETEHGGGLLQKTWGKIGTKGQSMEVQYASIAEATNVQNKQIEEKLGKGYEHVDAPASVTGASSTVWQLDSKGNAVPVDAPSSAPTAAAAQPKPHWGPEKTPSAADFPDGGKAHMVDIHAITHAAAVGKPGMLHDKAAFWSDYAKSNPGAKPTPEGWAAIRIKSDYANALLESEGLPTVPYVGPHHAAPPLPSKAAKVSLAHLGKLDTSVDHAINELVPGGKPASQALQAQMAIHHALETGDKASLEQASTIMGQQHWLNTVGSGSNADKAYQALSEYHTAAAKHVQTYGGSNYQAANAERHAEALAHAQPSQFGPGNPPKPTDFFVSKGVDPAVVPADENSGAGHATEMEKITAMHAAGDKAGLQKAASFYETQANTGKYAMSGNMEAWDGTTDKWKGKLAPVGIANQAVKAAYAKSLLEDLRNKPSTEIFDPISGKPNYEAFKATGVTPTAWTNKIDALEEAGVGSKEWNSTKAIWSNASDNFGTNGQKAAGIGLQWMQAKEGGVTAAELAAAHADPSKPITGGKVLATKEDWLKAITEVNSKSTDGAVVPGAWTDFAVHQVESGEKINPDNWGKPGEATHELANKINEQIDLKHAGTAPKIVSGTYVMPTKEELAAKIKAVAPASADLASIWADYGANKLALTPGTPEWHQEVTQLQTHLGAAGTPTTHKMAGVIKAEMDAKEAAFSGNEPLVVHGTAAKPVALHGAPLVPNFQDNVKGTAKAYYEGLAGKMQSAFEEHDLQALKLAGIKSNNTPVWPTYKSGPKAGLPKTMNAKLMAEYHSTLVSQLEAGEKADLTAKLEVPAPVSPAPGTSHGNKSAMPDFDRAQIPTTNTNAASHNAKVAQLKTLAAKGDVKGLLALKYGTNTYAKKQVKLANDALAALGSDQKVVAGQKSNMHPALTATGLDNQPVIHPTTHKVLSAALTDKELPAKIDFANYKGPGQGLSSKPFVNKANQEAFDKLIDLGKAGDAKAIKAATFQPISPETGLPVGTPKPISEHPSQHIKNTQATLLQAMDEKLHPPEPLKFFKGTNFKSIDEVAAAIPAKPFGTTTKHHPSSQAVGYFLAIGQVSDPTALVPTKTFDTPAGILSAAHGDYSKMSPPAKKFVSAMTGTGGKQFANPKDPYSGYLDAGEGAPAAVKAAEWEKVSVAAHEYARELPAGTTIYKWDSLTSDMRHKLSLAQPGLILQNPAPVCASYSPTATKGFGSEHRFKIIMAPGAKVVSTFSKGTHPGEGEWSLLPNNRLMVISHKKNAGAGWSETTVLLLPPDPALDKASKLKHPA